MKIINFSVVEILPSLLDKSKTQTIRKAWKDKLTCFWCNKKFKDLPLHTKNKHSNLEARSYDLNPRFKLGEQVKLVWNQRSKYKWFCRVCGYPIGNKNNNSLEDLFINESHNMCTICVLSRQALFNEKIKEKFNKLLGTVKITEVFKIEMGKSHKLTEMPYYIERRTKKVIEVWGHKCLSTIDLAKRDGFSSAEQMFKVIDKMYDLSTPKQFWIYRWKWIK